MRLVVREIARRSVHTLGRVRIRSAARYRAAVRAANFESAFVFEGVVPFEVVPSYIAVSQIGLLLLQPDLPGHALAMPHKLFDYMREAIPILAPSFTIEVRRIVSEEDCGVLVDVDGSTCDRVRSTDSPARIPGSKAARRERSASRRNEIQLAERRASSSYARSRHSEAPSNPHSASISAKCPSSFSSVRSYRDSGSMKHLAAEALAPRPDCVEDSASNRAEPAGGCQAQLGSAGSRVRTRRLGARDHPPRAHRSRGGGCWLKR